MLASFGVLALHVLVELYKFMMTLEEFVAGYGWGCAPIALSAEGEVIFPRKAAAVGAALSVVNKYRLEEDDRRIPACIALKSILTICTVLTTPGVVALSWMCSPVTILTPVLRTMISLVRDDMVPWRKH